MEATSDSWREAFYLLEAAGFETWLVNACDVKHLPGRPKTDTLDAGGHPGRGPWRGAVPHFLPELHVHLVAAAKAGTYVECFPILDDLLQEPLQASGGVVRPPERAGHGILWSAEALERYRVR